MNMDYVLDTNIFLRTLINEDNRSFRDCVSLFKKIKEKNLNAFVPGIVLSEIAWTLSSFYKFPKPKVVEAIQSIISLRGIKVIDDYDYSIALNLYKNYPVKYIDAVISSITLFKNNNTQIISYDADFDKLNLKRKEPGN